MNQSSSSESGRVTFLPNLVVSRKKAACDVNSVKPEFFEISHDDIEEKSSQTSDTLQPFIDQFFPLPTNDGFFKKRKWESLVLTEQSVEKRKKIDNCNNLKDEEGKVFNYMTGTYGPVVKTALKSNEHDPEAITIKDEYIIKEELTIVSIEEDQPHLIGSEKPNTDKVLSNVFVGNGAIDRSLSNNISYETSLLDLTNAINTSQVTISPFQNISSNILNEKTLLEPPKVTSFSESYAICNNNSNNSIISIHSPTKNSPQVDDIYDDTAAIECPENNSSLLNNISSADVKSNSGMIKTLLSQVNTFPKSNNFLSDLDTSCVETNLSKENINTDQTCVNLNVENDVIKSKYKKPQLNKKPSDTNSDDGTFFSIKRARTEESDGSSTPDFVKTRKTLDKSERKVQCFDCILFETENSYKLRSHACRHVGSKYQCTEHWKNHQENCLKCQYELVLQNIQKKVKVCKSCGFTALDKNKYISHVESKQPCKMGTQQRMLLPGEMLCFQCQYVTMHKDFLKDHMVDHLDQEFFCKKHLEKKNIECLECIHEECLKNAKIGVLICETCQYKTVNKDIFAVHGCNQKLIGSIDDLCDERQQDCNCTPEVESGAAKISVTATKSLFDHNNVHVSECEAEEPVGNDVAAPELNITVETLDNSCNTNGKNETDIPKIKNVIQTSIRMDESSKDLNVTEKSSENNAENQMEVPNSETIELVLETENVSLGEKNSVRTISTEEDAEKEPYNTVKDVDTSKTGKLLNDSKSLINNNNDAGKQIKLGCFDCKFVTENSAAFKEHICRHIGSKFDCMEHNNNKFEECAKCYYKVTLQNLNKEIKSCEICGYKTLKATEISQHITRDGSCEKWNDRKLLPEEIICFKCLYITKYKKFLMYHMIDHLDENLICEKHGENKDEKCLHCINDECLQNARKKILKCSKCNFKTIIKQVFNIHDCERSMEVNSGEMINHSVSKELHSTEVDEDSCNVVMDTDNSQNGKETSTVEEGRTVIIDISENENLEENSTVLQEARCFDCDFTCPEKSSAFRKHVVRHIGSKFQCIEHSQVKLKNCQICHYEKELSYVTKIAKHCKYCNYKTLNRNYLKKHLAKKSDCTKRTNPTLKKGEFWCFKCYYVTAHKKFLKYHMVDHLDSTLSCNTHGEKQDDRCNTCLNAKYLENVRKEVKICQTCDFKTVIKLVFSSHDCQINAVNNVNEITREVLDSEGENSDSFESTSGFTENNDASLARTDRPFATDTRDFSENENTEESSVVLKEALCFDCDFTCPEKSWALTKHVVRHIGSKFQCLQHLEIKLKSCRKCRYEQMLRNVPKIAKYCKRCNYRTIDHYNLGRHLEKPYKCNKWINRSFAAGEYGCLKCYYVTAHKKFLKYHMVDHLGATLSCRIHRKNQDDKCNTCLNAKYLENVKEEVMICKTCDFKTVIQQVFISHDCKRNDNGNDVAAPELNITRETLDNSCNTNGKNETDIPNIKNVIQASIRMDEDLNVTEKSSKNNAENQMEVPNSETIEVVLETENVSLGEKNSVRTISTEEDAEKEPYNTVKDVDTSKTGKLSNDSKSLINNNNDAGKQIKLRCFDCKFVTENSAAFKEHVCRHIGSKFDCMEHNNNKFEECPKCYYKVTLQSLNKEIKSCEICGYKTLKETEISQHITRDGSCEKWNDRKLLPEEIICFKCQYITNHKKFLMYHMVDHLDENLICEKHGKNKDQKCLHCINDECLQNARKKTLKCGKCNFKTIIKQVFNMHDCEGSMELNSGEMINHSVSKELRSTEVDEDSCNVVMDTDNSQNVKETSTVVSGRTVIKDISEDENLEENSTVLQEARCFDCDFTSPEKSSTFRKHVVRHIGSKFQCIEHSQVKLKNCQLCHYEKELSYVTKIAKHCKYCNYKTLNRNYLKKHLAKKSDCTKRTNPTLKKGESTSGFIENNDASLARTDRPFATDTQDFSENENTESSVVLKEAQCFDCDFTCPEKSWALTKHVVRHIGSKFQCLQHLEIKLKSCRKCRYEQTLRNVPKIAKYCKRCNYRTIDHYNLGRHLEKPYKCNKWINRSFAAGEYGCLKCYYVTAHKKFLKYHMVDHLGATLSCRIHRKNQDDKCNTCLNTKYLENVKEEVMICKTCDFKTVIQQVFISHDCKRSDNGGGNNDGTFSTTGFTEPNEALVTGTKRTSGKDIQDISENTDRCFDCSFTCPVESSSLNNHVVRHIGSKFQCMEHPKIKLKKCRKCRYEETLRSVPKTIKYCTSCNYRTTQNFNLARHLNQRNKCTKWMNRIIKKGELCCLKCYYVTVHKKLLKYHMVDHLDATLSCNIHEEKQDEECNTCLNVKYLENARQKVNKCKTCNFKTVIQQVFNLHECDNGRTPLRNR